MINIDQIYKSLKQEIKLAREKLGPIVMVSLSVGQDYSSEIYLSAQKKLATELDIQYRSVVLKKNISQEEMLETINDFNNDNQITGIFLHRPLPKDWVLEKVLSALDVNKDIEGVHPYNLGRLCLGKPLFVPPTVLSVIEYLENLKLDLLGKEVVIIGFSVILGKPLSIILADKLATVNITHIGTYKAGRLSFYVKNADIVISAVGKPELIKGDWIKEGAVVIDVGIGQKDGKVTGDVQYSKAKEKAAFITPVPGGVGKLTTLFLFKNLIQAAKLKA